MLSRIKKYLNERQRRARAKEHAERRQKAIARERSAGEGWTIVPREQRERELGIRSSDSWIERRDGSEWIHGGGLRRR